MSRNAGFNESPVYTKTINISQVAAVATGVFNSTANPFGRDVLITKAMVRVVTPSDGASTVDIGVAADATTANDGLIDGLSLAAAGLFNNVEDPGTNGELTMVWGSTQYLNVAEASGDVAGLDEAYLIVEYTYL